MRRLGEAVMRKIADCWANNRSGKADKVHQKLDALKNRCVCFGKKRLPKICRLQNKPLPLHRF
jgi:hypothetical protein